MDLKQIEKLMIAMRESRIKRVVLKKEDFEIEIESETLSSALSTPSLSHPSSEIPQLVPSSMGVLPKVISESHPPKVQEKGVQEGGEASFIPSPMVGTFYSAPSPEDPPFVKMGDQVSEGDVVCIIEAMKVMNEVRAQISGVITEVLLKNGEPVEFGTHLFRVKPT